MSSETRAGSPWKRWELLFLVLYAIAFYAVIIRRSLQLSHEHSGRLYGMRQGWISNRLNDTSDPQWRNFRGNLPILTFVFGLFVLIANTLRSHFHLKGKGMSLIWLSLSMIYLIYLHGACVVYILSIASINFFLVKICSQSKYFSCVLWVFNIIVLLTNRLYEGYPFSLFGRSWAFMDNYRGTFRWHICFNFVILRMISFGYDHHWARKDSHSDQKERGIHISKYSFITYICYLVYAPLYIAGPIISFNSFASQLDMPQKSWSARQVTWYGGRWILCLFLMELMTHFFYYNAFAISGLWMHLSPLEVFIIGYGVWQAGGPLWHSRTLGSELHVVEIPSHLALFSVLVIGIEAPENMPKCINNCYDLEGFWKSWHASFNKWLVKYLYIPLGGSKRKLLNVWVVFTFVAIWHDLEWKLLSWAWLTCLFFMPEMIVKSAATAYQAKNALGELVLRELSAVAGAITITCLMVANLVGYVIGPSGINWLISRLLHKDGLPVLGGIFTSFYVGTKLMFHIRDARRSCT